MIRNLLALAVVATVLVPVSAEAQPVAAFNDLGLQLNVGDRVRLVDSDGARHDGTIRSLSPEAIVIAGPGGAQGFTADTTTRIARRGDGLLNGVLIGGLSGFAFGVAFVNGFSDHSEPLSSYLLAGGLFGLPALGLGALVDALHEGQTTVYMAPGVRVTVAPAVTRGSVGLTASLRW